MKKWFAVFLALSLFLAVCGPALAEEDAVTSATIQMDVLPKVEPSEDTRILVVYFSPDDTVKAAAYTIASALQADLFEIVPEELYTEDDRNYRNNNSRSMTEMRDNSARPAVTEFPEDLSRYDTVILCYPIWGGQAPRILCTFLENTDLSGKRIVPFATSNSSGIGSSNKALQSLTDESAVWEKGMGIKKGATPEEIAAWALELPLE